MTRRLLLTLVFSCAAAFAQQASLVATYTFQNNLNASQGAPALTAVDPATRASFVTDTVLGVQRTVYQFGGTAAQQGGLTLNASGLVNPNSYSFEMLFQFTERNNEFRRVYDVLNRTSDRGLYVNNRNLMEFSRLQTGTATFATGQYYHLVVVNTGSRARLYLNGRLDIDLSTNSINLAAPNLMTFFLDNLEDTSRTDYASGRIALLRVYTNQLTEAQAAELARDPFASTVGVGAPSFSSADVRNGATFASTSPIAPGAFFTILGSSLASATGDWSAGFVNGNAPTTLNGARVLINNQPAFLSFASPGQINAIAPDGIATGPANIVVERDGVRSTTVSATARALNPAFFTYDQRNRRFIAALAADNSAFIAPADLFGVTSINGLAVRPARPGDFVIAYGMGMGPTNPAVPAGRVPPARDGGYPITGRTTLRFGARTIDPLYVGLSSFAGVYLVGFQVPDLPTGDYELQITVNDIASVTGVVIPVVR